MRNRRASGKNRNYSFSRELRKKNKSSDEFEVMLSNLTLEELISLKLEVSARNVNGKLYGIPLWRAVPNITKDALLRCAYTMTNTQHEAAKFLGLNLKEFKQLVYKFRTNEHFARERD
jgi:hypothetical protein